MVGWQGDRWGTAGTHRLSTSSSILKSALARSFPALDGNVFPDGRQG